jgi:hypothetical protein
MNSDDKNLYQTIFDTQVTNAAATALETWTPDAVRVSSSYDDESTKTTGILTEEDLLREFGKPSTLESPPYMDYAGDVIRPIRVGEVKAYPAQPYRFNEDQYIAEAMAHIDATYEEHYSGEIQATEVIIDAGHGTGFNIGNIIKYAKRYGKKNGYNRKDLLKIIHYAVMQLYVQDKENL